MPRPAINKETIKKNTIESMKKLGTYKREYEPVIDIYSELSEQYNRLTSKFKESNYKDFEVSTADGGSKKSALVSTLESLRKDILQYASALGLTPKASSAAEPTKKKRKGAFSDILP